MKYGRIILLAFTLLLLADHDAFSQSSFLKNRQSFYKYRYGRISRTYHRACGILERKHNPPRSVFALFRKRSKRVAEGG